MWLVVWVVGVFSGVGALGGWWCWFWWCPVGPGGGGVGGGRGRGVVGLALSGATVVLLAWLP